jgi:hypothetical protein
MRPKLSQRSTRPTSQRPRSSQTPDDPAQSKAFIEKAREIGADEKRSAADKLMEKLAKMKPEPRGKARTAKE